MTRPAILLAAALALSCGAADARECLSAHEFRATEHKVRLKPHCWAAVRPNPRKEVVTDDSADRRHSLHLVGETPPASDQAIAAPVRADDPAGTIERESASSASDVSGNTGHSGGQEIGHMMRMEPYAFMPGWVPMPTSFVVEAIPAGSPTMIAREIDWAMLSAGLGMLGLGGFAAWAWPRRRRDAILRDSLPIDPELMPRVAGAGTTISFTARPERRRAF